MLLRTSSRLCCPPKKKRVAWEDDCHVKHGCALKTRQPHAWSKTESIISDEFVMMTATRVIPQQMQCSERASVAQICVNISLLV